MIRSTTLRKAAALAAALVATGGLLATSTAPAGALTDDGYSTALLFVPTSSSTLTAWRNGVKTTKAVAPTSRPFAAHLNSYDGGGAYLYNPGSGADSIVRLTSKSGGGVNIAATNSPIGGTYVPIVGDFDNNNVQDILWYGPGTAPDSLWLFWSAGGHTVKPVSINGNYRPTATRTRTTAHNTDIIWYGPGSAPDSIWQFDDDGNHTTKSLSIGGNYIAIPGEFGENGTQPERVIWWNKAGADYIWLFDDLGDHFSYPLPNIDGNYQPLVGNFVRNDAEAVFWYKPGSGAEKMWSFQPGGALNQVAAPGISGTYSYAVGDYDGSTYDEIAWTGGGKSTIWKFKSGGSYTQQVITGLASDVRPVAIPMQFTPDGA